MLRFHFLPVLVLFVSVSPFRYALSAQICKLTGHGRTTFLLVLVVGARFTIHFGRTGSREDGDGGGGERTRAR
uniref:Putative secreted protein n=1 Tax=Anopheles darlingi TaxID=43151 RepID=A0A2M4DIJ2_ANODA